MLDYEVDEMSDAVTFQRMARSKPKTSAEGQEQLSSSLARMALAPGASKGIPITEVGFGQCRFVVDDRTFPALCCGEATLGGSWCAQHRALVFVRVAAPANGRRLAQEPAKAAESTPPAAVPAPKAPASRSTESAGARPGNHQSPTADARIGRPEPMPAPTKAQVTPIKVAKPSGVPIKDRAAKGKKDDKTGSKGDVKPAEAAALRNGRASATKTSKAADKPIAKAPLPAKKAAERKSRAAKPAASVKKVGAARKSSPAKQPPARKAPIIRKALAAKRTTPAKKTTAARKSPAAKRTPSAKKASVARKSKAGKRTR